MSEVTVLAIDLAKHLFQLHGVDANGRTCLQRRLTRAQLLPFIAQLPACTVAMEACAGAHYWARQFRALGHSVQLIAPQYVKAFNRGQKNDRNDAQAIACAARQPHIVRVAVKSEEQQAILTLHRLRERLLKERVAAVNQLHGLLGEFGLVLPRGFLPLQRHLGRVLEEPEGLPALLLPALREQYEHLLSLQARLQSLTRQIEQLAHASPACQTLMRRRGVGALIATAFVCEIGQASVFKNGRQVAAWLGLVPRQHCTGGRIQLLGITKRGNRSLRRLLVHGARTVLRHASRHAQEPLCRWALAVKARRGTNRATVALANKIARQLWAALRYERPAAEVMG